MRLATRMALVGAAARRRAAASARPLRFLSNGSYAATSFRTLDGTRLRHKSRQDGHIGAGDRDRLVLSFKNWRLDLSGVVPNTNAYTIVKAAVEIEGVAFSVPVTFGGLRTRTVAAGATDVQADALLPAAFGLAQFAVGTQFWIRVEISVTTSGHSFPEGPNFEDARGGTYPAWIGWAYDPAANTTTSDIDGVGPIGQGNGQGDGRRVLNVVPLGRFVAGDPTVLLNAGDSIAAMSADSLAGRGFAGYFARALTNDTFNGGWGAGMSFGVSGAGPALWQEGANLALATTYWQYANAAIDEFGTNTLYFGGSLAALQASDQALWALMRAQGVQKIIKTHILPRTDSTDNWSTAGNQTPVSAAFGVGGSAQQFNTWLATQIGPTGITSVVQWNSVRNGGNSTLWLTNGTPNYMCDAIGTHPVDLGHALMATEMRAAIAAL